jgi:hypothetical protein
MKSIYSSKCIFYPGAVWITHLLQRVPAALPAQYGQAYVVYREASQLNNGNEKRYGMHQASERNLQLRRV